MPINLSDIWRERKNTHLGTLFFEEHFRMPEQLPTAIQEDYPTDEEDEADAKNLNQKVPELTDLINDFEKEDEVLKQATEATKTFKTDQKMKGYEIEARYDIKDIKREKKAHMDSNISSQRAEWGSRLVGMVEDINEQIREPRNKLYLR